MEISNPVAVQKMPWNKGKLVAKSHRCARRRSGQSASACSSQSESGSSPFFNLALDPRWPPGVRDAIRANAVKG